jgi:hypothetical protein
MSHSERRPIDWRGWAALAWVLPFTLLYVRMILERRAPGLLRVLQELGSRT